MIMVVVGTTTPNHKTTSYISTTQTTPFSSNSRQGGNNGGIPAQQRRPKSREVSSRYLSTSSSSSSSNSSTTFSNLSTSSRRYPSPVPSRPQSPSKAVAGAAPSLINAPVVKRALSVERRRPMTPKMSAAAKLLVSSSRSLSVSFQGESFALPRRVVKPAASSVNSPSVSTPGVRKRGGTPERRRNAVTPVKCGENTRPSDQPWPGRVVSMSRSVDLGCDQKKLITVGSDKVVRALKESLISDRNSNRAYSDLSTFQKSETESVSSGGNSGSQDGNSTPSVKLSGVCGSKGGVRSLIVAPRHWPESKRGSEPSSPMARTSLSKGMVTVPPKLNAPRKIGSDSPVGSPRRVLSSRGNSSPIRGAVRPASPSKMGLERNSPSTVMGRMASPSRVRSAVGSTPSVLCYRADVRTVKVGDNRLGDAHLLRLLYNRHLQWRFVNAKAEASLSIQQTNAERSLYNAWKATSDLCGAVSSKRQLLQWLRLKLKIVSILKSQILHLEEWALIDEDHCTSLSGAAESLTASTIRLPLIAGARVDVQDLKEAICSAADVMHWMASSICALSPKVEEMNSLVSEVACLTSKERSFLNTCKDTLSMLAAMQVEDWSLRAHILQLKCALSSLTGEV